MIAPSHKCVSGYLVRRVHDLERRAGRFFELLRAAPTPGRPRVVMAQKQLLADLRHYGRRIGRASSRRWNVTPTPVWESRIHADRLCGHHAHALLLAVSQNYPSPLPFIHVIPCRPHIYNDAYGRVQGDEMANLAVGKSTDWLRKTAVRGVCGAAMTKSKHSARAGQSERLSLRDASCESPPESAIQFDWASITRALPVARIPGSDPPSARLGPSVRRARSTPNSTQNRPVGGGSRS